MLLPLCCARFLLYTERLCFNILNTSNIIYSATSSYPNLWYNSLKQTHSQLNKSQGGEYFSNEIKSILKVNEWHPALHWKVSVLVDTQG